MQGNHIDGEATNLLMERGLSKRRRGAMRREEGGLMHEGTPSPVAMPVLSGCILRVSGVCACCRACVQPRKPAR